MAGKTEGPFVFNASTNSYELRLNRTRTFPMSYCTFCGGDYNKLRAKYPTACQCQTWWPWAADPDLFIKQDRQEGRIYFIPREGDAAISTMGDSRTPLHFCPACGEHLFETDEQSKRDIAQIEEKLKQVKTLTDVAKVLGKPTSVFMQESESLHNSHSPDEVKDYDGDGVTGLAYTNLTKTVDLWVHKSSDGKIRLNPFQARKPAA